MVQNVPVIVKMILELCSESHRCLFLQPLPDDRLHIRKSAAADKENIAGIDSCKRDHGIFAAGTDRYLDFSSLQKL